jgi:hypothetical protein
MLWAIYQRRLMRHIYAHILKEIDKQNREYAHRRLQVFRCVAAAASRPLRVEELAEYSTSHSISRPDPSMPTFLVDWRPEDPVQ